MLDKQKHLFDLPDSIHYLNGAYMSPQLRSVEEVGMKAISHKNQPFTIHVDDFFKPVKDLKQSFAQLVNAKEASRIAIIPAVSYGIATIVKNIELKEKEEILIVDEQFPSNYYSWKRLADQTGARIIPISPDIDTDNRTANWNQKILESIQSTTRVVSMCHVHWADGTLFDFHASWGDWARRFLLEQGHR